MIHWWVELWKQWWSFFWGLCHAPRQVDCGLALAGVITPLWWHGRVGLSVWHMRVLCAQGFCALMVVTVARGTAGWSSLGRLCLSRGIDISPWHYSVDRHGPWIQSAGAMAASCVEGRPVPGRDGRGPGEGGCSAGRVPGSSRSAAPALCEGSWWESGPRVFACASGNIIGCHPLLSFWADPRITFGSMTHVKLPSARV